jgi:hypothetical protein
MNRFQRLASNYKYYGYITKYEPQHLRKYQSERNHGLGRKGAYDTLVIKMGGDHISYEEDFNIRYKTPPVIVNLSMRIAHYWFWIPMFMLSFMLGDMIKLFVPHTYMYAGNPGDNA